MGLDAVEIIMEIEDAFDIKISDHQAENVITVGDLYDLIIELKRGTPCSQQVCLSAAAFYRIRRAACATLGLSRKSIRPRVSLESTIPRSRRREIWEMLETELNLKLPRLTRPTWLVNSAAISSVASSLLLAFLAVRAWGPQGHPVVVFFAALFATGLLLAEITSPFQTRFKPSFATFRGLSYVVLAHNYAALSKYSSAWNAGDVWEALRVIIVEQLGVEPEKVTRDASFVEDLGMA